MDRVRFGRVLGKGARLAARTAMEAVDAATAPTPGAQHRTSTVLPQPPAAQPVRRVLTVPVSLPATLLPAAKAASAGVIKPLRQATRALWHELTGSFFALFALTFGVGVWHTRANLWSGVPADHRRFIAFCLLTLLFLYFSISSFTRAHKRSGS